MRITTSFLSEITQRRKSLWKCVGGKIIILES
jgi:hypothetical protein